MKSIPSLTCCLLCASSATAAGSGAITQAEANRVEDGGHLPAERAERHVILMPVVGLWNHPFEQDGWTAKPGPLFGMDVKIEPFGWLGVRASVLHGRQPLETRSGLAGNSADVYQPTLKVTQLQLRAEPTLRLTKAFSGYVGLGIGWGRFVAPEAVGSPRLHTFDRSGVFLGYEGALGMAYEPRADRVILDLSLAGSLLGKQSGTAYESVQAFTDAGHRTSLGGLSHFSGSYRVMFGVGFVL
jgi:opacity protein-like surface antigen